MKTSVSVISNRCEKSHKTEIHRFAQNDIIVKNSIMGKYNKCRLDFATNDFQNISL